MDHLTALKVFRAVAANGGFAAAARQMNLSPAAVSKNVAELEAHLKVRLINRTTRSMTARRAGEVYRQRLERILDDLEPPTPRSLRCSRAPAACCGSAPR